VPFVPGAESAVRDARRAGFAVVRPLSVWPAVLVA